MVCPDLPLGSQCGLLLGIFCDFFFPCQGLEGTAYQSVKRLTQISITVAPISDSAATILLAAQGGLIHTTSTIVGSLWSLLSRPHFACGEMSIWIPAWQEIETGHVMAGATF